MIIKNGMVFGENGTFEKRDLYLRNGIFTERPETDEDEIIDAEGLYVVPGFVDIHTHGAVGHDFCDASVSGLTEIARYEKSCGITSFCPTSMTYPEEKLSAVFQSAVSLPADPSLARVVGINMEGPYISYQKRGAQNPDYIEKPDVHAFQRLNQKANGFIRLVTLAPETENAMGFIEALSEQLHISLGHSCADYDTASLAFKKGADHVTHLFNAMPPFHHRDPGIIGAAMDQSHVMAEVICDLIHLHPSVIRSIYRQLSPDRMILISDSMEATGMPDGTYALGGQTVYKKGSYATLEDGTLAGSASNLFTCFQNAVKIGIPLEHALKMVTCNPARSIGLSEQVGTVKPGACSDILLLNQELQLIQVLS